jgi:hypothetical protein
VEIVWFAIVVAVCAAFGWLAFRIEPHWVSKDGRRFLCNAQRITTGGEPETRWRETRVIVSDANRIQVDQKRFMRRTSTFWKVASRSQDPPRGREVFLLTGFDDRGNPVMLALRLPKNSRAVGTLERALSSAARTS